MVRKALALALALCLVCLAGCSPSLSRYPRVERTAKVIPPQALTMDIPEDADQLTKDAINRFAAAVLELSDGAVTIQTVPSSRPAVALRNGDTHLALLTNRMLMDEEPSLSFLDWPFLMNSPQQYLTVMGAEDGVVRGNQALSDALGGDIIGMWYSGRTVLLCRNSFYEEICFFGSGLGVLEDRCGSGFFSGIRESLRPKALYSGSEEELLDLLEGRTVKYLEYPLQDLDPENLPETLKYVEDTAHRIQGTWLVLGRDAVDEDTAQLLAAAAAYVPRPALEARLQAEEAVITALKEGGVQVRAGSYDTLHRAARDYYAKNYQDLECPARTWRRLAALVRA